MRTFALLLCLCVAGSAAAQTSPGSRSRPRDRYRGGTSGGQTIVGGREPTDDLTLKATAASPSDLGADIILDAPGVEFLPGTRNMTAIQGPRWSGVLNQAAGGSLHGMTWAGTINYAGSPFASFGPYFFVSFATLRAGANNVALSGPLAFVNDTIVETNGFTGYNLTGSAGSFHDHPNYTLTGGGSYDAASAYLGFDSAFTPGTGLTWPTRTGFRFRQEDGAGSVTTQVAFLADDLTSGTTSTAFESAMTSGTGKRAFLASGTAQSNFVGGLRIGDNAARSEELDVAGDTMLTGTLYGGTAAGDSLDLTPTNAADGTGDINLCSNAGDYAATASRCLDLYPSGFTIATGSQSAISWGSTVTQKSTGAIGLPRLVAFDDSHTQQFTDSSQNATDGSGSTTFWSRPTLINNTNDNQTNWYFVGFDAGPTFSAPSTGTMTVTSAAGTGAYRSSGAAIGANVTVPVYDDFIAAAGPAPTGTLTTRHMFLAEAPAGGTNRAQYAAAEHTITGTVPSGEGWWGVQAGAPNRFYFKNESGHLHVMGTIATIGFATSNLCATTNCVDYFPAFATGAPNATEASVSPRWIAPGDIKVCAISCGLSVATGAGATRKFDLVVNGVASTNVTCTTAANTKTCSTWATTCEAATAGQPITVKDTSSATAAAATLASCTLRFTNDAF